VCPALSLLVVYVRRSTFMIYDTYCAAKPELNLVDGLVYINPTR